MGLEKVNAYLMEYTGKHYTKPIDENDPMQKLAAEGKAARESINQLVKKIEHYFSGYTFFPCSTWINMNQVVNNHFWVQMKKVGYENCFSSIALAAKLVKGEVYFYIAVEIKVDSANRDELARHNKILNMEVEDSRLYYSEGNDIYFNLGQDKKRIKILLEEKQLKKARLQLDIEDAFNTDKQDTLLEEVVDGIQTLLPYYNAILPKHSKYNKYQEWVTICNPKKYDVIGAFKQLDVIEWKQSTNVEVGDVVYIYISAPYKEIKYKCKVTKVDLNEGVIDDSEFVLEGSSYTNYGRYMELKLINAYEEGTFPYDFLKAHGLNSVQGPSKVVDTLSRYLNAQEIVMRHDIVEKNAVEDSLLKEDMEEALSNGTINSPELTSYEKKEAVIKDSVRVYPRDRSIALRALDKAEYLCEIDATHPTFMRRSIAIPYTEPHHLIPLAFSDLFDVSLDIEENIISLCSNCHNQLHYGEGAKEILKQLYENRKVALSAVGLELSIEELLHMYHLME